MATIVKSVPKTRLARSRGWLGLVVLAPFAVVCLFAYPTIQMGSWGQWVTSLLGWMMFMTGGVFRWWATLYIGGRKGDSLVCEGPYSICRNPLYWGTFLLTMTAPVMLQSVGLALGVMLATVIYLGTTIPAEEARLLRHLGEPYLEYCRRVPRFLPNFRLFKTSPFFEVRVEGLWSEFIRMTRWIWIPLVCEVIGHLRAEQWWPHFSLWN